MFKLKTLALAFAIAAVGAAALPEPASAEPPRWAKHHWKQKQKHHWKKAHHRPWKAPKRVKVVKVREVHHHHHAAPAPAPGTAPTRIQNSSLPDLSPVWGGRIVGGVLGAAAGTQIGKGDGRTAAIVGGTLIGAVLGGEVAREITRDDEFQAQRVLETTPTGRTSAWVNPDNGARYEVTPTETYQVAGGQVCRDYETWVFVDGYEEKAQGTSCRLPDGTWTPSYD